MTHTTRRRASTRLRWQPRVAAARSAAGEDVLGVVARMARAKVPEPLPKLPPDEPDELPEEEREPDEIPAPRRDPDEEPVPVY